MGLAARVRTAHGDAWAAEGVLREPLGGGTAALTGIRVMASGLPQPQWNGADVTAAHPDLDGARAFYAARGLPLGVRVPEGMAWHAGRHVLRLRLMGLEPRDFAPATDVAGLAVRAAVAAPFRRRGVAAAVSTWLLARGFESGARLAHLHADTEAAARVYARLGFSEAGALEVFAEV